MSKRGGQREDDVGIACPRCGCRQFSTTKTMRVREGMVRRYKRCRHCERTVVTHEVTTRREAARLAARGS